MLHATGRLVSLSRPPKSGSQIRCLVTHCLWPRSDVRTFSPDLLGAELPSAAKYHAVGQQIANQTRVKKSNSDCRNGYRSHRYSDCEGSITIGEHWPHLRYHSGSTAVTLARYSGDDSTSAICEMHHVVRGGAEPSMWNRSLA